MWQAGRICPGCRLAAESENGSHVFCMTYVLLREHACSHLSKRNLASLFMVFAWPSCGMVLFTLASIAGKGMLLLAVSVYLEPCPVCRSKSAGRWTLRFHPPFGGCSTKHVSLTSIICRDDLNQNLWLAFFSHRGMLQSSSALQVVVSQPVYVQQTAYLPF